MSTPETPDAAPGADALAQPGPADAMDTTATETATHVGLTPPLPTVAASDAAASASVAEDDFVPPAPATTAVLPPPYVDTRPPAWDAPTQTAAPERPVPAASVDLTGPRIRWAGIVWGLVLAAIAAVALWVLLDPARQAVLTSWLVGLNPATAIAIAVLLLGMFALITGVVGIARRAQRGLERRRAASAPART
ncbi:hypothetical protein [Microbacterium sp. B35-30]|uniref:hypothetical protein n=1 Tax=Microbacterium sp. B35-30 TaxID=1962642 RepID=UPI001EF8E3FF|nr:hypothetical protein [Microbacterium sp. B35-30]